MSLTLLSCRMASALQVSEEDGRIEITARNAGSAKEGSAAFEMREGDFLVFESGVESGGIGVSLTKENEENPVYEHSFEKPSMTEVLLEEGRYELYYEILSVGTNGTLTVRKASAEQKESETDGENAVGKVLGDYVNDRCMIHVEEFENGEERFTVHWGSSVSEYSEWIMSGPLEMDTMTVNYRNAVRKNIRMKEDGTAESETVVYQDGRGFFRFDGAKLYWNDEEEQIADNMEFGFAIVD